MGVEVADANFVNDDSKLSSLSKRLSMSAFDSSVLISLAIGSCSNSNKSASSCNIIRSLSSSSLPVLCEELCPLWGSYVAASTSLDNSSSIEEVGDTGASSSCDWWLLYIGSCPGYRNVGLGTEWAVITGEVEEEGFMDDGLLLREELALLRMPLDGFILTWLSIGDN